MRWAGDDLRLVRHAEFAAESRRRFCITSQSELEPISTPLDAACVWAVCASLILRLPGFLPNGGLAGLKCWRACALCQTFERASVFLARLLDNIVTWLKPARAAAFRLITSVFN